MMYSSACVDLVKRFEGFREDAYLCPAGIPTIGYGSTRGVRLGMTITEEEAARRLREDLDAAAKAVFRLVIVPLTRWQIDALTSFAFNVGGDKFASSTLLRKLNVGDRAGAAAEFERWVHAGGKVLPGLVARRRAEADLFRGSAV